MSLKFLHIVPLNEAVYVFNADSFEEARVRAELGDVDFGALAPDLSICVNEKGLLQELDKGYFSIGRRLYGGNAIVFAVGDGGETASISRDDVLQLEASVAYYKTKQDAWDAIDAGHVDLPQMRVNGDVVWEWK